MPTDTAAERKAAERTRKRAQGLVLKHVWVPPHAWPVISSLATDEVEDHVHKVHTEGGSYMDGGTYPDGVDVALAYETAATIAQDLLAQGEVHFGKDNAAKFQMHVMRAMLKTYSPEATAMPELVEALKEDLE